jgi:hypothetical protein
VAETFPEITEQLAEFIARQPVFFVATAPTSVDGLVNLSPKGLDTFRVLDPTTVAYLDLTGSGIETISHLRDNGRICIMFSAFEGPAQILRLHGRGEVLEAGEAAFEQLYPVFTPRGHARAIVRVDVQRIATSCGYAVPLMAYQRDRDVLDKYWERKAGELLGYRREHNGASLDGLPGLRREPVWPGYPGESATRRPPSSS